MGSAVSKVEGLGAVAWIGLGAIHVDLGGDYELVCRHHLRRHLRPGRHRERAICPGQVGDYTSLSRGRESGPVADFALPGFVDHYNERRGHGSLGGQTPCRRWSTTYS